MMRQRLSLALRTAGSMFYTLCLNLVIRWREWRRGGPTMIDELNMEFEGRK